MHYLDEGYGAARPAAARRADLVVPVPQDRPGADAGGTRDRAGLLRLRPLRQAAPASRTTPTTSTPSSIARLVEELDLRDADRRRPGLGRPDRAPARRRAPRPRRAARDHEHRDRRRPPALGRVAALPRLRPPRRHRPRSRASSSASPASSVPDEVEAAYSAPWPVPESKAGVLAFPELVPISSQSIPTRRAHLRVRDALSRWEKPALVLFSDSDPIFSPRVAERIAAHIPGALEPEIVAGAGPLPAGGPGRADRRDGSGGSSTEGV